MIYISIKNYLNIKLKKHVNLYDENYNTNERNQNRI